MKNCIVLLMALWLAPVFAAEPPVRPNILFILADDASHFGATGCTWTKTPHIDRLAQRGLVFDRAYTPTAKCAPSRAAILTGRNPWQLEDAGNHQSIFPPKFKAFTEAMSAAGLNVGATGKFWGPGLALTAEGQPRTWGLQTTAGKKKQEGAFAAFLKARDKSKPFFFWYGSHNPHRPYKKDAGLAAGKKTAEVTRVPGIWPDNDVVRGDMLDYATKVEAFDAEVGECLRALEAAGLAENTLVIVTSDNGMPFPRSKGHTYDIANRMPFVAYWPRGIQQTGTHCAELISFIDLAPTFLALLGVDAEKSGMAPLTGRSFADLLRGQPAQPRPFVILGRERTDVRARPGTEAGLGYPSRAIRAGQLYYIHNFAPDRWPCGNPELGLLDTDNGPTKTLVNELGQGNRYWELSFGKRPAEELFDLATDPDCLKNLAADPAWKAQAAALREQLFAELKRQNDPRILGQGDVFDRYPTSKGRK